MICRSNLRSSNNNTNRRPAISCNASLSLEQEIQKQQEKEKEEKEAREKAKQGTISVVELAAQQAAKNAVSGQSNDVGAKYQGDVPSEPNV